MSSIKLESNASGTGVFTLASPNSNTNRTLTLPDQTGTVLTGSGAIGVNASAPTNSVAIDSSGRVGIGTSSPARQLTVYEADTPIFALQNSTTGTTANDGTLIYVSGVDANIKNKESTGGILFQTGGDTERMRINSSGNVGIGTSSPAYQLDINNASSYSTIGLRQGGTLYGFIEGGSSQVKWGTNAAIPMLFEINGTERGRFTSGGALCIGKTGIFDAELLTVENTANGESVYFWSSNASLNYPVQINRATRNTTNGTYEFFRCVGAGSNKFVIADSGNATNTNGSYGTISDAKLKQDITDATPQWDDIKNLRFRKYRLKNEVALDPNAKPFLGLIAQEAELVCPGLIEEQKDYEDVEVSFVDEAGNSQTKTEMRPTGTTTKSIKTSILYMKAVKALQEAQLRIETLEAQNAAFEARLAALEAK